MGTQKSGASRVRRWERPMRTSGRLETGSMRTNGPPQVGPMPGTRTGGTLLSNKCQAMGLGWARGLIFLIFAAPLSPNNLVGAFATSPLVAKFMSCLTLPHRTPPKVFFVGAT